MNPPRRAFTLAELIVVTVLLAVIAGAMVPRLARNDGRAAAATVESVRQLLSAAAERQVLTSQRLVLSLSASAGGGTLGLLVPSGAGPGERSADADPWVPDSLAPPVALGSVEAVVVVVGESRVSPPWRVELSMPEGRPEVLLVLRDPASGRIWRVELAPEAMAAHAAEVTGNDSRIATAQGSVDLDQGSTRDQPW